MTEVLYRKRGRRYVPVAEYDQLVMDALPKGAHLIIVEPGITSYRRNVDPDYAGVLAAVHTLERAMQDAMRVASLPRPSGAWTKKQLKAWDGVKDVLAGSQLTSEGLHGIVAGGCRALEEKIMEARRNGNS